MPDHKPMIGVISCRRMLDGEPVQRVIERYLDGVSHHANAIAVIVPNNQPAENAPAIMARLDAILLTGSATNIQPARYGEDAAGQAPFDPSRDALSAALVHAAIAAQKPVFGICRGLQEINVALGGTLVDMRSEAEKAEMHHAADDAGNDEMFAHAHAISVVPGTALADYSGVASLRVNSVHFQTIGRLGDGLVANATSADGVIEAISATATPAPVFAVQWHPEWQPANRPHDLAFWSYLGRAARAAASFKEFA